MEIDPVFKKYFIPRSRTEVCKHLLVLLYFHIPGVIRYLFGTEQELLLKENSILGKREAKAKF